MNNSKLLIAILVLIPGLIHGQNSYLRFSVGYGFPAASQALSSNSTFNSTNTDYTSIEQGIYGTLGSGLVFNAAYGHLYSRNLGLDVALQYLSGRTYESSSTSSGVNSNSTLNTTISASGYTFRPSLVMTTGEGKVKPYLKAGLTIGMIQATSDSRYSYTFTGTQNNQEAHTEITGGLSFGYHGALGFDFGLSEKVNFFTEVMLTSLSYYPDQREVTSVKLNGVEQPSQHSKTIYKESITRSSSSPLPAPGSTTESLQVSIPLSSISINAGIRIKLKSKKQF